MQPLWGYQPPFSAYAFCGVLALYCLFENVFVVYLLQFLLIKTYLFLPIRTAPMEIPFWVNTLEDKKVTDRFFSQRTTTLSTLITFLFLAGLIGLFLKSSPTGNIVEFLARSNLQNVNDYPLTSANLIANLLILCGYLIPLLLLWGEQLNADILRHRASGVLLFELAVSVLLFWKTGCQSLFSVSMKRL